MQIQLVNNIPNPDMISVGQRVAREDGLGKEEMSENSVVHGGIPIGNTLGNGYRPEKMDWERRRRVKILWYMVVPQLMVKKRVETWIILRPEIDLLFNTSKSNKHLWDQISFKMRENGFDRSTTMCTDKWRNLLKVFKKAKKHENGGNHNGYSINSKMQFYKEVGEIIRDGNKNCKVDFFMHFSDKGASACHHCSRLPSIALRTPSIDLSGSFSIQGNIAFYVKRLLTMHYRCSAYQLMKSLPTTRWAQATVKRTTRKL
ncbi:hypothetical protein Ccrd_008643 [Cynara cardunculus var. scolymus]|uniref:Myb/SANT-like DNA-binding domain-containing protein n=1 Tax=Cynara cardunculus var. scolymus TaxID=59895 RepID=A0A103XEV4_CYNCS|nr:hypothetical protein Ccrd_008643 [Cynara cardunculus var. scolymus]